MKIIKSETVGGVTYMVSIEYEVHELTHDQALEIVNREFHSPEQSDDPTDDSSVVPMSASGN